MISSAVSSSVRRTTEGLECRPLLRSFRATSSSENSMLTCLSGSTIPFMDNLLRMISFMNHTKVFGPEYWLAFMLLKLTLIEDQG